VKKFLATSLVSLLTTAAVVLAPATSYAAGSANLAMSGRGSRTVGSIFRVNIIENSGTDPVNVVQADLSYDSSKLQLAGAACNTSAFEITAPGGSGITCGTSAPKSGAQTVGSVSFKVLAAGSGAVNFASSSHIYRSTDNADVWNGAANLTSFAFAAPAPVAPAPVAATTTPAPAPVVKKSPVKHVAPKTAVKPADNSLTPWIYLPLALLAAAAGIAYVFRNDLKDTYIGTKKSVKNAAKSIRKTTFQRS
jgi:hypothetical protein